MKRLIKASTTQDYTWDVIAECDDEMGNPTCWGLTFYADDGSKHFIWVSKYNEKDYRVETEHGLNLGMRRSYKTLGYAKKEAERQAHRQQSLDMFTS